MQSHFIMIRDGNTEPEVKVLTDDDMAELFTSKQIEMLSEGTTIVCNSFHGNEWVKRTNAVAVDMVAVTLKFTPL